MAKDIYELYSSYNNKEIDEAFINKSFDLLMKNEQELLPYIKDFIIIDEENDDLGSYSNKNKIIKINKKNINEHYIQFKNILGLQVLKHEIEHARNLKKLEQRKHDIESKVILYALRYYAILEGIDLTQMNQIDLLILMGNIHINYEIDPGERIAEIKSWKFMVNLLKNHNKTEDLLLARTLLYYAYIRGYKDNRYYLDCPTYSFLLETNQLTELKKLKNQINKTNYSLDTRLLCGLPITYDEYNEEILTKVKLQKRERK